MAKLKLFKNIFLKSEVLLAQWLLVPDWAIFI